MHRQKLGVDHGGPHWWISDLGFAKKQHHFAGVIFGLRHVSEMEPTIHSGTKEAQGRQKERERERERDKKACKIILMHLAIVCSL